MVSNEVYIKRMEAAGKKTSADIVIKNGKIIDVFNLQIIEADVAITEGMIVGIGDYQGKMTIDAEGRYISPAFIDSHVHIESSMVTPREFSKIVVPHGVTTVVTDPHEIANVKGEGGIQFILDDSEGIPLDVMVMLPSCVPATPFENAGATLNASDLQPFYSHPRVIGLAEVMDFPSVRDSSTQMAQKLLDAEAANAIIDGHGAGLDETGVNVYRTANILTDHECTTVEEALDRVSRGIYVQIREGSVAKDLTALLPAVHAHNARRFVFCTDDKHIDDLLEEGSVDHNIRLAIQQGMDPLQAIQLASLNTAECYRLRGKGAVAPGYKADFLLLDDLHTIEIFQVYKDGELVAENGKAVGEIAGDTVKDEHLINSVHVPELTPNDLAINMNKQTANIIGINPNSLLTNHLIEDVQVQNGQFIPSIEKDQLKIAVIERHHGTGNIGLAIVKGFAITSGAIATSVAHDSHNVVVVGTNDEDMMYAVEAIGKVQGGIVIVKDKQVIASLSLPIGGVMTKQPYEEVIIALHHIESALQQIGFTQPYNPLLTLSFLSLPVIPDIKLTDLGLFNVKTFQHIQVEA